MATTRWLDEDETDAWIRLVGLLMFLPSHLEKSLEPHGVNFFEYSIMAALSDAPGRQLSMTYLSDRTHGSLSRLSHAITRLESRGACAVSRAQIIGAPRSSCSPTRVSPR